MEMIRFASENNNTNLIQNASFSSHLNANKEPSVIKLAESNINLNSLTSDEQICLRTNKVEDGEIDVFSAEKYFNEGENERSSNVAKKAATKYKTEEEKPISPRSAKSKIREGTPSIHSETSWNSQSALLQNITRNLPQRQKDRHLGKSFLASLGCKCSCTDKKSVDIDEHASKNISSKNSISGAADHGRAISKQPFNDGDLIHLNKSYTGSSVKNVMPCKKFNDLGLGLSKEDRFTFSIPSSEAENLAIKMQLKGEKADRRKIPLQVFGSPVLEKGKKNLRLERTLDMPTWDAIPRRVDEIEVPESPNGMYNDTESVASSDLFEIDSFSNNPNPILKRQGSDGMSSPIAPTTCYAPSEASIDWSIVTASAADFSVMSDMEDVGTGTNSNSVILNSRTKTSKDMQKRLPSILSGCKSHKAVRVAGDAYRSNQKVIPDPRGHHRLEPFTPGTRFQNESKLMTYNSRNGQHALSTPPLSLSLSPRLYIH